MPSPTTGWDRQWQALVVLLMLVGSISVLVFTIFEGPQGPLLISGG